MGIPGIVSSKTGLVKNANTVCLNGKPLDKDLHLVLGRKAAIENDANCFVLAEAALGAAKSVKSGGKGPRPRVVFGVIMGTGCGGGIVIGDSVVSGLQHIAGEWGHMSIDPEGPSCYCGKKGCVETFISGGGVQRLYQSRFGVMKPMEDILAGYRKKDQKAVGIMEDFFEHFGIGLSNVLDILDPDIVVLGGGLSNIRELYTRGVAQVRKHIFSDGMETPIVRNKLGDSAGVLGAAMLGV